VKRTKNHDLTSRELSGRASDVMADVWLGNRGRRYGLETGDVLTCFEVLKAFERSGMAGSWRVMSSEVKASVQSITRSL
jgi:hypothetical protein